VERLAAHGVAHRAAEATARAHDLVVGHDSVDARRGNDCNHDPRMNRDAVERWIRAHVEPIAPIETTHERAWATVLRVPTAAGSVWFKACGPVQAFEARLTAELSRRWPKRVADVLAHDEEQAWLLLADAGTPLAARGNLPEVWLEVLPRYAELQRGETQYTHEHLAHDVPDRRAETLPHLYDEFVDGALPLERAQIELLRAFAPTFAELCGELAGRGIPPSVQHDDLHYMNVYLRGAERRVLDWGDASIAHPFFSFGEIARFLQGVNGLPPSDPWHSRLRDAYLEPWGGDQLETFELAFRVGAFAQAIAWLRQREHLRPPELDDFDVGYRDVLARACAQTR
jgi:hypothetical protein